METTKEKKKIYNILKISKTSLELIKFKLSNVKWNFVTDTSLNQLV